MKPSSTSTIFKNIQNFRDAKIDVFRGTRVSDIIRVIAGLTNFNVNQVDIVTITLEGENPLSVLSPKSVFPSILAIENTIYYYFLKPIESRQKFVKIQSLAAPLAVPPLIRPGAFARFPSSGGRTLGFQPNAFTARTTRIAGRARSTRPKQIPLTIDETKKSPEQPIISPPLLAGVKGKEKLPFQQAILTPMTGEAKIPVLYQTRGLPLPPNVNPNAWNHPIFMQKLQLLSETIELILSRKPYSSADVLVYYHSDSEKKTMLDLLGDPISIESASKRSKIDPEVYYYLAPSHDLIIPLAVRFIRTSGIEITNPILFVPDVSNNLLAAVKISISPDTHAVQLTPIDYYSSVNLFNSILWLLVNHPGFSLPSPNFGPLSYVQSPPYSPSDSPPVKLVVPKRLEPMTDYIPIP